MPRPNGTHPCCYGEDGELTQNVVLVRDHPDTRPEIGRDVAVCQVCGRRHLSMIAEPAQIGVRGARL